MRKELDTSDNYRMNASETLATIFKNYSEADAYADEGTIISGNSVKPVQFKTFRERPNRFRFQWSDQHFGVTGAIWSDGVTSFKRINLGDLETVTEIKDLEKELKSLANQGALKGVLHTIPPAFFGMNSDLKCLPLKLRNAHFIQPDKVKGQRCYRVVGSLHGQKDTEIWIRKDDQAIKKIIYREKVTLQDFETQYEGRRISFSRVQEPDIEVIKEKIRESVTRNPTRDLECIYDIVRWNKKISSAVFVSSENPT
jgi:hypothetical protein